MFISVDGTSRRSYAHPDLLLLADAAGWRELARVCRRRAIAALKPRTPARYIWEDPEDHGHLELAAPLDEEFSDLIGVRIGTIWPADWKVLRSLYRLTKKDARKNRGAAWLSRLAEEAAKIEKRERVYDRLHSKQRRKKPGKRPRKLRTTHRTSRA